MGLKKELDVFAEFCRSEEAAKELSEEDLFNTLEAVDTLKKIAEKLEY